MKRTEILGLLAILAAIISLGFAINAASFAENGLASVAGLIAGIFVAFYLIDRISRRERQRRWERVKKLSYRSIESMCDRIMFAFLTESGVTWQTERRTLDSLDPSSSRDESESQYESFLHFSTEIDERGEALYTGNPIVVDPRLRVTGFEGSVSETRNGITRVSDERHARDLREEQLHIASSQQLLRAVIPHFEKLSLAIFPRIFELDEQEDLISGFIQVESAYHKWEETVDIIEGSWGMPESYAWGAVAEFCEKIAMMLRIIHRGDPESED